MSAFDRYAPFIQDFIYEHEWESLRGIQVAAADAIFNSDNNVLLTASTASGKTEAAFFPILTEFWENPPTSVGAIYIAPLKALINDQFARLNELCEEADIPVWRWHGDVSQSHKNRLMKKPSGILQITPESLESLLMHKHMAIGKLFGDLRYIVIDEVHSLLRADRGGQTLCLIERLSRESGTNPRRIGLSATIGSPEAVGVLLSAGTGRNTVIPQFNEPKRPWRISMEHFYNSGPQAPERDFQTARSNDVEIIGVEDVCPKGLPQTSVAALKEIGAEGASPLASVSERPIIASAEDAATAHAPDFASDIAPQFADPGYGYIFEHTRGKKCLVFSNSREEAEAITTTLRSYCEARHEPDRFLIHHGNLSSTYRETAEELMKDDSMDLTTVTTATLELGIDIGRLERAFQVDAPFTVSSFLQRMGRTGRRDLPPEMWFVMREDEPEPRTLMPDTIPWKLLQGIALVQVYLEERWVEPPRLNRLPFSLLYHQTMATLASCGELTPPQLAQRVLSLAYFHRVSLDDYRVLLRHLLETEHVQTTEAGGLIVGLAGERVTNSFKFYAVFQDDEEFTVRCDSQELGTVVLPPPVGERLAIAGHVWLVEEIDRKRHLVYVSQIKGKVPAYFGECAGDINTKILERMRLALQERQIYPYLMENGRARLSLGRRVAKNAGVTESPLVNLGGDSWALFPWLGSYAFMALERFLKVRCAEQLRLRALDSYKPYYMQFRMQADAQEFFDVLAKEASIAIDPMELVYQGEVPYFEKYDLLLPKELIRKGFAYGVLDIEGMLKRVAEWTGVQAPKPGAVEYPEINEGY
jgi:ATP-dependent helicase Lhr and Lhr-like helicase